MLPILQRDTQSPGLPTTMLIDREGNEVGRLEGMANWESPAAEALIRHYLGSAPSPQKKAELR